MKYCPKCGRQLADGEVCTCQSQNQPQQPQMNAQPMGQFNGQPQMNAQQMGQFNGQPQMNAQPKPASPVFTEMGALVKGMFKTPVASITHYVNNASAATSCIVIAIIALLSGFEELLYIAGYNIKHPLYSTYEGVEIFTNFLQNVVTAIGTAALFALVIMLLVNAFEKDHKITYVQALAVASLVNIIYWPVATVSAIIDMIPVAFFGYVADWMNAFGRGTSYAMVFLGIKAVERDDNHMPIVYGVAVCAVAVLSTIINLIF